MKNLNKKMAVYALVLIGLTSACKKVESPEERTTSGAHPFAHGVFISNEGSYGSGTGTISFFDRTRNIVTNDIFEKVNNRPLGNIVQSMEVINDKAFIVVNNANKIEVVNASDFKSIGSIKNLEFPRYIIGGGNGKAYVSQWSSSGSIAVIQLSTLNLVKTIATADGPDRMLLAGNKLYVVNTGGFGSDNRLSVINTQNDVFEKNIQIGDSPNSLVLDVNNKLWVLCGGKKVYEPAPSYALDTAATTAGSLYRIDAVTGNIEMNISFSSKLNLPSNLCINNTKDLLFFNGGDGIYSMPISGSSLPTVPIVQKTFYGLGFDPIEKYIYAADPQDYQGKGVVYRYTETGNAVDNYSVGIIPGNFLFR